MNEKQLEREQFNKNIAVFVDFDFTLYEKFLWQALFAHHFQNRFKRLAVYRFIAFHFPPLGVGKGEAVIQELFLQVKRD